MRTHISLYLLTSLPPAPSHPSRRHRWLSWALCHTDVSHKLSILHKAVMSVLLSQFILPSPSPPPCPQVCYLCLHLYSWAANRFIDTTFTDPIYIHVNIWYLLFSLWFTSFHMTDIRFIHINPNDSISFLFMAIVLSRCVGIYVYACIHTSALSVHLSTDRLSCFHVLGYCP